MGQSGKAVAYSKLEFPNTYYLAYRDLPAIIARHVKGTNAVDFGCGAGRSTRFLKQLGFHVMGIEISEDMLEKAMALDPGGDYRLVSDGNYQSLGSRCYDLVQCIFTFDNIAGKENRIHILKNLGELLNESGKLICLDAHSEMYTNQWASFSTREFPENRNAETGDIVKIIVTDIDDNRPVEDIFWTRDDYAEMFDMAGFDVEAVYHPKGKDNESFKWIVEKEIAPWDIYILKKRTQNSQTGAKFEEK